MLSLQSVCLTSTRHEFNPLNPDCVCVSVWKSWIYGAHAYNLCVEDIEISRLVGLTAVSLTTVRSRPVCHPVKRHKVAGTWRRTAAILLWPLCALDMYMCIHANTLAWAQPKDTFSATTRDVLLRGRSPSKRKFKRNNRTKYLLPVKSKPLLVFIF